MASSTPPSKANNTFSLALLKKLSEEDKAANVFFSPFSISAALAMVMLGAKGNTFTQISEVLGFSEAEQLHTQIQQSTRLPQYLLKCLKPQNPQDEIHSSFKQLLSSLIKDNAPYALSLANRLYGEQTYRFIEKFLADSKQYYNAELETVDFKKGAEEARVNINSWVEKQTQDKIKDLLKPGAVDDTTVLVLVNAIYFKGSWSQQFDEKLTTDGLFRINKNDTKSVKMMRQTNKLLLSIIAEANLQILEMSYEGKDLSMLIFLPNDIEDDTTGLEKLEKELTYEKFTEWTRPDMMSHTEVEVQLPRFKLEESYDLKEVLTSMGMVDAFEFGKANFTGMSTATNLVVSQVVHKSFVDVNEEGTEAAAATGVIVVERSAMIPSVFNADHPFLFFIRHNPSMTVLFAGRYCSPE
ncbi:leukocyte elastase inhibitor-like isoform X2 [Mugil cephalus]|uniref:leukocyte elastase inhibitor-like isoform X2 n=1 Tax=Mugil cephalus TaxID=48193 RepID=UPI001FB769C5|nr:leukocyte elastase inhibitor-like isoform X2 [Mugil cephalus]